MTTEHTYAVRVVTAAARRHYLSGGSVAVSVSGDETLPVGPQTVTHAGGGLAGWEALTATVESYGDPRQAFYNVPRPPLAGTHLAGAR